MNLYVYEEDKSYVQGRLEQGEVDYMETSREVAEAQFFEYIDRRGILWQLADTYPFRRKKEEVPTWLYIASDLSLRLHGLHSFHSYPLVIRSGGLMKALGPKIGKKAMHPKTEQITMLCEGFNKKNRYDRETPCDQDFLRKIAKDTKAEQLWAWYNREAPKVLKEQELFDEEGIFIGDASYIFVPDNEHYEGSVVLLFDEHNHPVNKEELTPQQLKRCRYRRCYKWIELIHTNRRGEFFFFAAMAMVSGKAHENPVFYALVEHFLRQVGPGVMKWLLVDRGFLDGEMFAHLKEAWGVDTVSGLKSNMDILDDARRLLSSGKGRWQEYRPLQPQPSSATITKPLDIIKREQKRQQTLKAQGRWPTEAIPERVAVFNDMTTWDACTVPLTVILTEQKDKPPWGLVSTARTTHGPLFRDLYHLRTTIEERHRQTKLFWNLTQFTSPNFNLVCNQIVFVGLAYTLLQLFLFEQNKAEYNTVTRPTLFNQLLPFDTHVVIYHQQRFSFFTVPEYTQIVINVQEPGKSKLLLRCAELQKEFLGSLKSPRPP